MCLCLWELLLRWMAPIPNYLPVSRPISLSSISSQTLFPLKSGSLLNFHNRTTDFLPLHFLSWLLSLMAVTNPVPAPHLFPDGPPFLLHPVLKLPSICPMVWGLNGMDCHRLIGLHAQSPVGDCFGRIRRCGRAGGGVSLRVDFEVSEAHIRPHVPLPEDQDVTLSHCSSAMCPAMVSTVLVMD